MKPLYIYSRSSIDQPNTRNHFSCASIRVVRLTCLILLTLLVACGSKAVKDQAEFEKDSAALAQVRRIQTILTRSQSVPQSDLDFLKSIHAKYPKSSEVRQLLQTVLQLRQDWLALEKLIEETPASERTTEDQIFLAKIYVKLGRYQGASRILAPLADAAPNDVELNSLAGHAWYFEGKYDDAARAFDRVWDALVASKRIDEILMRGMISFYKGENDRAIEVLKKTVEMNPDYIAGNNALSRVYAAKGDQQQAEVYRTHAENVHARMTAEESRQMRATSRSRDLESAFAAGRFEESIRIAREMLQFADPAQKSVLYEYIGKALQATGKQPEAQSAFQEAARLRGQAK